MNIVEWVVKSRTGIFTGLSIASAFAAVTVTAVNAPKARMHIDDMYIRVNDAENDGSDEWTERELTVKEIMQACWKDYIPSAVLMLACAAFGVASCVGANQQLAAAIAAAGTYADALGETKDTVKEVFGETGLQKLNDKAAEKVVAKTKFVESDVISTGEGDILYLIPETGDFIRASSGWIKAAMVELTTLARDPDGASVADWIHIVTKQKKTIKGPLTDCGWSEAMVHYRQIEPRFGYATLPNTGEAAKVIMFTLEPKFGYEYDYGEKPLR